MLHPVTVHFQIDRYRSVSSNSFARLPKILSNTVNVVGKIFGHGLCFFYFYIYIFIRYAVLCSLEYLIELVPSK
jgi:hypothetical protein